VMALVGAFLLAPADAGSAYTSLTEGRFVEAPQGAPSLVALGDVLSMEPFGSVNAYVLRRKVPGQAAEFVMVRSRAVQPPVIPGATVGYSVKSALGGSWSAEVLITYSPALAAESTIAEGE